MSRFRGCQFPSSWPAQAPPVTGLKAWLGGWHGKRHACQPHVMGRCCFQCMGQGCRQQDSHRHTQPSSCPRLSHSSSFSFCLSLLFSWTHYELISLSMDSAKTGQLHGTGQKKTDLLPVLYACLLNSQAQEVMPGTRKRQGIPGGLPSTPAPDSIPSMPVSSPPCSCHLCVSTPLPCDSLP